MTAAAQDPHIGLVVEGPGDAKALPVLLRKWLDVQGDYRDLFGKPIPCNGRDKALVAGGLEGYVATAAARPGCVAVLLCLDGEGDLVCQVGPQLLQRARKVSRVPVVVALADRTFEDWIYCSAETLELDGLKYQASRNGLGAIVTALRPAKYVKPTLQPRLTARIDVQVAQARSASLERLFHRLEPLLSLLPSA